jgi:hypothetical protein
LLIPATEVDKCSQCMRPGRALDCLSMEAGAFTSSARFIFDWGEERLLVREGGRRNAAKREGWVRVVELIFRFRIAGRLAAGGCLLAEWSPRPMQAKMSGRRQDGRAMQFKVPDAERGKSMVPLRRCRSRGTIPSDNTGSQYSYK